MCRDGPRGGEADALLKILLQQRDTHNKNVFTAAYSQLTTAPRKPLRLEPPHSAPRWATRREAGISTLSSRFVFNSHRNRASHAQSVCIPSSLFTVHSGSEKTSTSSRTAAQCAAMGRAAGKPTVSRRFVSSRVTFARCKGHGSCSMAPHLIKETHIQRETGHIHRRFKIQRGHAHTRRGN